MSDLAQWIAYQRRATVFGTPEETVLALLDVAEASGEVNAVSLALQAWTPAKEDLASLLHRKALSEIALNAAIRKDGLLYVMERPYRHHDLIRGMALAGHSAPVGGEQGFITSEGRFVSREEAGVLAFSAGQTDRPIMSLLTENVW